MRIFQVTIILALITSCAFANVKDQKSDYSLADLKELVTPFSSDGCSKWPEGTNDNPEAWLECCYEHDISYWMGGTEKERLDADLELRACVTEKFSEWMGFLMYYGVRTGGRPGFDTSYRWGYGWKVNRGYFELSELEREYLQSILPTKDEDIHNYIKID